MQNLEPVVADTAPEAIGPYSHGIVSGGPFVYCSGQTPLDPATGRLVAAGVEAQVHQVFRNLSAVLAAAGTDLDRVVKVNVYLRNMSDFPAMNAAYEGYFPNAKPARTTVAVAGLPLDALVEIELVAVVPR